MAIVIFQVYLAIIIAFALLVLGWEVLAVSFRQPTVSIDTRFPSSSVNSAEDKQN